MNRLLILSILLATGLSAAETTKLVTLKLTEKKTLSILVPTTITATPTQANGRQPAMLVLADKKKDSEVRVMFGPTPEGLTVKQIKTQLIASGKRLLPTAVEKDIAVKTLEGKVFTLIYFELTDKRPDPGDGRYMLQGMGIGGGLACQFMMITKTKDSKSKPKIISCLKSMTMEMTK